MLCARAMAGSDDAHRSALFNDLYQLTMSRAYDADAMSGTAVFEAFFRSMPERRSFVVAAGLEDVLAYMEGFCFSPSDLDYLATLGSFPSDFLTRLGNLLFTGDVDAVPEGTIVFANEPILRVTAPIIQAQLVETFVLNQLSLQTLAVTKAARIVLAAGGRPVVDFGTRRAHGTDAALRIARTSWMAGFAGTSNLLAGKLWGIPVFGTMAHSYVQAHADEAAALESFTRVYPDTTILVDTYDTLRGVEQLIELARRTGDAFRVGSIRLDSGDLGDLSHRSRQMLDEAGLGEVRIIASSGLDEYGISRLVEAGAPIDTFAVGTHLATIEDSPVLDLSFRLVEYDGRPTMKLSPGKISWPGAKQVFRRFASDRMVADVIARSDEELLGEPLLQPILRAGQRVGGTGSLASARERTGRSLAALPGELRNPDEVGNYPVAVSERLARERAALRDSLTGVAPRADPATA